MSKFLFAFFFICFLSKSQTIIDSLSINPNPFQKRTLCTFSFSNNDTVSINVYNAVGNIIYSPITDSIMPSGIYQDSLIMDSYVDGIYFVHLKFGNRKIIAKRILKSNTANVISNYSAISDIFLYPNPTKDIVKIKYSGTNDNKIIFFDVTGKLLLVLQDETEVDISHLANGFYYVQLQSEYGNKMFKVIKE